MTSIRGASSVRLSSTWWPSHSWSACFGLEQRGGHIGDPDIQPQSLRFLLQLNRVSASNAPRGSSNSVKILLTPRNRTTSASLERRDFCQLATCRHLTQGHIHRDSVVPDAVIIVPLLDSRRTVQGAIQSGEAAAKSGVSPHGAASSEAPRFAACLCPSLLSS